VTRKVESSGNAFFAGANYRVASGYRRRHVQVAVVGDQLEISIGEQLIHRHTIKHDRTREHGVLANPGGATPQDQRSLNPTPPVKQLPKSPRQAGTEA
jgi:hypothetical protein